MRDCRPLPGGKTVAINKFTLASVAAVLDRTIWLSSFVSIIKGSFKFRKEQ